MTSARFERSGKKRRQRLGGRVDLNPHVYARRRLLELAQHRGQPVVTRVALGRHAKQPLPLRCDVSHLGFGAREIGEHPSRGLDQVLTRGGRDDAAAAPQEQWRAEAVFDVAKLMAQGRLRQVQLAGGGGEAAQRRDRLHQPKVSDFELHGSVAP